jgi:predicted cation transporter
MDANLLVNIGLLLIFLLVLVAPFTFRWVEQNLEIFLFICGIAALTFSGFARIPGVETGWNLDVLIEALTAPVMVTEIGGIPIGIVQVVLVAGLLIYYGHESLEKATFLILQRLPLKGAVFILIVVLGILSSIISAIIAAVILVEMMCVIPLSRDEKGEITVISCFAIGLGAALTPLGEPLSTIAVSKLSGPPYYAGFDFLYSLLGYLIIPGIFVFGIIGMLVVHRRPAGTRIPDCSSYVESRKDIVTRAAKVYLFIMALVFLGEGFKPVIMEYVVKAPAELLYWINMVSAALDNATLASAEIDPSMTTIQIKSALLGLLVAGGMLIPGNIPNIIASHKLKISPKEWARKGVPLGIAAMVIYFILLFIPFYSGA